MSANLDPSAVVLSWCRPHRATIRFLRDGSVTIRVGRVSCRAPTLVEAWRDAVDAIAGRQVTRRRSRQMELGL